MGALHIIHAGKPASGKSYSYFNIDPKNSCIILADKKPIEIKGFGAVWNEKNKNLFKVKSLPAISALLKNISDHAPNVKLVVVDTLTSAAGQYLLDNLNSKDRSKYGQYANDVLTYFDVISDLRDDLIVCSLSHTMEVPYVDENGDDTTRVVMNFEGAAVHKSNVFKWVSIVLGQETYKDEEGKLQYRIRTISNGRDEVRCIKGILDEYEPSDMVHVIKKIRTNYFGEA